LLKNPETKNKHEVSKDGKRGRSVACHEDWSEEKVGVVKVQEEEGGGMEEKVLDRTSLAEEDFSLDEGIAVGIKVFSATA